MINSRPLHTLIVMALKNGKVFGGIVLVLVVATFWFFKNQNDDSASLKTLYSESHGQGDPPLVLLHGLFGSHRYWDPLIGDLSSQYKVITVDLLGFGESPMPDTEYTVIQHINYLKTSVDTVIASDKKRVLMGHSMGAILALNYAQMFPNQISGIMLINPPTVSSSDEIKNHLQDSTSSLMLKITFDPFWGKLVCKIHELFPNIYYPIIRLIEPDLPAVVAGDSLQHTWESFSRSFEHVLHRQDFSVLIRSVGDIPILMISSRNDPHSRASVLNQLHGMTNVKLVSFEGGHNFLLQSSSGPLKEILSFVSHLKN